MIALGALPANSESEFPSARVRTLATEIFGESGTSAAPLHEPQSCVNAAGGAVEAVDRRVVPRPRGREADVGAGREADRSQVSH